MFETRHQTPFFFNLHVEDVGHTVVLGATGSGKSFLLNFLVTQAEQYVAQHGGGTIGVSSQQGASGSIIGSGAKIAALGGFSGRESEVSTSWFAQAVKDGRIRWVVTDNGGFGGPGRDGRVGSSKLMTAVKGSCKPTSVTSLYDCQGSSL